MKCRLLLHGKLGDAVPRSCVHLTHVFALHIFGCILLRAASKFGLCCPAGSQLSTMELDNYSPPTWLMPQWHKWQANIHELQSLDDGPACHFSGFDWCFLRLSRKFHLLLHAIQVVMFERGFPISSGIPVSMLENHYNKCFGEVLATETNSSIQVVIDALPGVLLLDLSCCVENFARPRLTLATPFLDFVQVAAMARERRQYYADCGDECGRAMVRVYPPSERKGKGWSKRGRVSWTESATCKDKPNKVIIRPYKNKSEGEGLWWGGAAQGQRVSESEGCGKIDLATLVPKTHRGHQFKFGVAPLSDVELPWRK